MLKKCALTSVFLLIFVINCISQSVTNYTFASSSGTFTAVSGGTTLPGGTGTTDDGYWNAIPIGFNFWYMGTMYTTISASTNGWLTLGADITNATYTNSLSSGGSPRPVLAPLWDDLDIQSGTNAVYSVSGSAGSQVLTLQFLNNKWDYSASGNTISFQVKLHEGTGKIEYVYRQESGSVRSGSASIGITATATGSGKFLSLNGSGSTPTASSTTETSNISAKPSTGRIFSFTPPVPTAATLLTFTLITTTGMTLNWVDNSSNETGFLIYRSTDGVNYSFITQTAANTTSSAQTGLSGSTTYYWRVYPVSEGALSTTALSGSQATACTPPAAPTVTSPVNYCLNASATALTATGSNLLWGGTSTSGSCGGTSTLTTPIYVDAPNTGNNKKTNFTTTAANVTITTVDYYIPAWQAVNGLQLAIFNNAGTVIATSSTTTSQSANSTAVKITNTFNYAIASAGNYSIGIAAGSGNVGSDNPSFPITELTGTINTTGVSVAGYRCFNNIQFTTGGGSPTAPTPITTATGSTDYLVSQTVGGCTSTSATITVNVTAPNISQIPASNLIANYTFSGNANDATNNNDGTLQNAPSLTSDRFNISNKSYSFNGSSQYVSTSLSYNNPANFTISAWFKTATTSGGKLIGFGSTQVGTSGQYDRHIYMNNAGQIYFGVYPGTVVTVNSTLSYNDNNWHIATATLSSVNGMSLYVDGVLVGSNSSTTSAENYTGYWKIGYDNMNGWTSSPSSGYFNGVLDDVLIYDRALSPAEVATIAISPDGAGNNGPVCSGSTVSLSATTLGGATYAWTGPNSYTSGSQNPSFTYTAAKAGVYTVQVTVAGCTATAYTNIVSTSTAGQWSGNVDTDWSNGGNWCSGSAPASTTDVIISSSATNMPSITGSASCRNLTINPGATITTTITGTLNITGTFTNNGTANNNGTTNFNGTSGSQTFSGITSFYNLVAANTTSVLLPVGITVNNDLTISAGILNANNFNITVKGNWTNNVSTSAFTGGTGTVSFGGSAAQTIGGTYATTFNNCTVSNTSNTVSLNVNAIIGGNLSVSAGTFNLGSFTANRATSGGTLTVANNATLKIGGTNTYPTNYTTNTLVVASTVEYSGTNQTVSNQPYGNLKLSSSSGAAVKTFPGTALTVLGNLISTLGTGTSVAFTAGANTTISGNVTIGASTTFNGSSYTQSVGGNWTNSGTFNGNTGTISFTGSGTTVSGAGTQNFNNLTVAASAVNFSSGSISLTGNLATTGSGSFTQASGGTLIMTGTGKTISGTGISIDNLTISGTVSTSIALAITGNLSVSGSFTSGAGTITLSGTSKTMSGAGTISFGTLIATGSITSTANFSISSGLVVNGSLSGTAGTATFTGTSTLSGTANLYDATVNGTSLQLSAGSVLGVSNALTITAGTLDVTSIPNTVNFNGTGNQNVNGITYNNLGMYNGGNKTAAAAVTVNSDLTIGSGTTFIAGNYTHSIYQNFVNNGIFTAGTGTIQFSGNQNSNISGATTFNNLTINNSNATTSVILQSDVTAATVNMTLGTMLTGSNTINITTTRTGNGIILGNIKRTHAFTIGVDYAFEGPDNTVRFTVALGVTSITVSVTKGAISDFPFNGSISRVYDITIPSGTYISKLRLHYEDAELNGANESTMALWKYNGSAWASSGKTANSTTSNYVEQSGLTNITNRWTMSDNSNVVQWNGSVSTDWNTAANWTVLQGSASAPPAATDIVNLGTAVFTYNPTISSAVTVKNINFGSVQALTLTMASGGSLTSGDIHGTWSTTKTHTINANNQTITINGDMTLSDGVAGDAINLNIGTGTVYVGGSFTQSGGANVIFSGAGNLNIATDMNYVSGTFTPATGTVTYSGVTNQTIGAVSYYNLSINKAAQTATITNSIDINGDLNVIAGTLDNYATTTVYGNATISGGASLNNYQFLHIKGNWYNNGSFTATGAKIYFDGTGTQTISATTFNNFIVDKPVGSIAELTGNIAVKGDFTVTSGTLDLKSYNCNRNTLGGTLTMDNSATLIVGGNNLPSNFSTNTIANASTVIFDGSSAQSLAAPGSLGNVIFRNAGVKTLIAAMPVNGDLTIESGATFSASSYDITLNGNWVNSGTFTPSTGTLLFTGTTKTLTGITTFNTAIFSGSYTILSNSVFNTLLHVTSTGALSGGGALNITMNGDLINSGTLFTLGTTTFTGNALQTLSLINAVQTVALTVNFNGTVSPVLNSTSAPQFGYLNINNTGGINPSVGWNILYSLTIGSGASFNGGNSTHNLLGTLTNNGTITSSGTFNFIPASAATLNLGTNFTSTGIVNFGGAGAITLAGTPAAFHDVLISNTNGAGISPVSAWNLSNNFTINSGSIFNAGSYTHLIGGNITNNGTLNSGTSTFKLNGTGTQDIYNSAAFKNLTVDKASGNTVLFTDMAVNGTLNFVSGSIQTGSYSVTQSSTGTVTSAAQNTGWVNGKLQKNIPTGATTKTFEVGDATSYTPALVEFSNVSTAGDLNVSTTATDHPAINSSTINSTKSVNRYWTMTNSGIVFTDYDVTCNFVAADIDGGANTAYFGIGLNNGSSWSLPTVVTANATDIKATGLTYIGSLAVGEACNRTTAISYPSSPYCSNAGTATVTVTGTTGGTFTSSAGLALNAGTGAIDLINTTPDDYQVTYSLSATGGCPAFVTSTGVIVSGAPSATIAYTGTPYCSNAGTATVTFTGTSGGKYSSTIGLALDTITGSINLLSSTAGTYTITYTINTFGGCATFTTTANITVTDAPDATISYLASPYCSSAGIATITHSGTTGGTFTSTAGLSINAATGDVTLGASTLGTYTVDYTIASAGGCAQFQKSADIAIVVAGTWTGAVNGDWDDSGNWLCGQIPATSTDATIPTSLSIYPDITLTNTVHNITIETGASLTITGGTLQIAGTISNSGTFDATNGTIEMNGSSPQTIPSQTFVNNSLQNLIINNDVTLADTAAVTGTLTIAGTNQTFTTGDFLILKSTAAGTAKIAQLPVDGSGNATSFVVGKVMVERYIPARRAWRLLTAPLSNTGSIYGSWQNGGIYTTGKGMFVTGPNPIPANGLDASSLNTVSMKSFSTATQGFVNITNTKAYGLSNSTGSTDNIGYFVFVRGDRSSGNLNAPNTNNTTLTSEGYLQTGKQTFAASATIGNYTLLGNPYAAPINFNNVGRTHLMKRFYAWDATINTVGAYVVLDDLDGDGIFSKSAPSSSQNNNIQSGQAFFVVTDTAGPANLTVYESSKSTVSSNAGFRPAGQLKSMSIMLNLLEPDSSTSNADATLAEFDDSFSAAVNLQDAVKFGNVGETFSLLRNNTALAIERRPLIISTDTLFLRLTKSTARDYQVEINPAYMAEPNLLAYFEDKYTGTVTPIDLDNVTKINFTISSSAGSKNQDRFMITFKQNAVLPVTYSDVKAWKTGKNIAIQWKVENQLNIKNYDVEKSTDGVNFVKVNTQAATGLTSGTAIYNWLDLKAVPGNNFYRIRNTDLDGSSAYSKTVVVNMDEIKTGMTVYPNPVTNGVIDLQLKNMVPGQYNIRLINVIGQVLLTSQVNHTGGNADKKISLSKEIVNGMYNLEITAPDNSKTIIPVICQ
ncbi:MAG: hypothetical protein ABIP10_01440 [Ferruginibacter sp.]